MHWWLLVCLIGFDGTLVLRNGTRIAYTDTYEVRDGYVLYRDKQGNLFKLPEKIVDLETTEKLARAASARPEDVPDEKEKLTAFERFARDAEQSEEGEGGNFVVLRKDQQVETKPVVDPRPRLDAAPAAAEQSSPLPSRTPSNASCAQTRAKLTAVESNLSTKRGELDRENAKQNPSESEVARLTREVQGIETYAEQLRKLLAGCPEPDGKEDQ